MVCIHVRLSCAADLLLIEGSTSLQTFASRPSREVLPMAFSTPSSQWMLAGPISAASGSIFSERGEGERVRSRKRGRSIISVHSSILLGGWLLLTRGCGRPRTTIAVFSLACDLVQIDG